MNKLEFSSANLPYRMYVKINPNTTNQKSGDYLLVGVYDSGVIECVNYDNRIKTDKYIHIIRNLSDLTKECVQADYNDGKPFVPIVELAKYIFEEVNVLRIKNDEDISGVKFIDYEYNTCVFVYHYKLNSFCAHIEHEVEKYFINVYYQLDLFKLLLKWHFWIDMPENEEVIYVTDDFNPYK
jgi:hypothetical protein